MSSLLGSAEVTSQAILDLMHRHKCSFSSILSVQGENQESMLVIGTRGEQGSTPMRGKNYDVLKKATTWIAVQKVLNHLSEDAQERDLYQWFYGMSVLMQFEH